MTERGFVSVKSFDRGGFTGRGIKKSRGSAHAHAHAHGRASTLPLLKWPILAMPTPLKHLHCPELVTKKHLLRSWVLGGRGTRHRAHGHP